MTLQEAVNHTSNIIADSWVALKKLGPELVALGVKHDILDTANLFLTSLKDVRVGLINWT
jgi:hypothetical protein